MKTSPFAFLLLISLLGGCVSGPPRLTPEQHQKPSKITIHRDGEKPEKDYSILGEISAADCSGAPAGGRVFGNSSRAIDSLKLKAAAMNADAVINVRCGSIPFLNNCWAAMKCDGEAVVFR